MREFPPAEAYQDDRDAARGPGERAGGGGPITPGLAERAAFLAGRAVTLANVRPILTGKYLVKGWLDRGAFSVVLAAPKTAKTFAMLDLCVHLAAGEDWHGNRVGGPARILYVALEGGAGALNRLEAIRQRMPDLARRAGDNFVLLPVSLDLHGAHDVEAIAAAFAGEHFDMIVIDTLARAMGDGDESSARDMGAFVRNVDRLRELTSAHLSVVHHLGKDTSRGGRGSSALFGALDTEIRLERPDEDGPIVMRATAQKDMGVGARIAFDLDPVEIGTDEDGDAVTSCVLGEVDLPEEGKRQRLGKNQATALEALRQFVDDHGTPNPGGAGWPEPGSRRVVAVEDFTAFLTGKMTNESPKDRRKSARKAVDDLVEKRLAQINGGSIWLC